jgi:hypothetical protein
MELLGQGVLSDDYWRSGNLHDVLELAPLPCALLGLELGWSGVAANPEHQREKFVKVMSTLTHKRKVGQSLPETSSGQHGRHLNDL